MSNRDRAYYDPVTQDRLVRDTRWPGALRNALGEGYEIIEVAQEMRCAFPDAGTVIVSSPLDGIHFEAAQLLRLGTAVAQMVQDMSGENRTVR